MNRNEAAQFARDTLNKYHLEDWKVRIANDLTHTWLGKCVYADKCIYLNAHHVDIHGEVEVNNTILHEVAHALMPGHAHDELWAIKAREIGCVNPQPCATYGFDAKAIDAIRSGQILEVTYDEKVIRTPKYTVTQLKDKCPTCGKVAEEVSSFEKDGKKVIFLKCLHIITKVVESFSPFENITFDGDESCQHEWNGTECIKCKAHKFFPYQVETCKFLERANGRGGVFHEMGLGKTLMPLGWLHFHPEAYPFLAVVKSGIKYQWMKEIVRVLGLKRFPQVIKTSNDYLIPGLAGYIISYDMLVPKVRQHNGKTIKSGFDINKFKDIGVKCLILDECQQIKNVDSTRTHMVRRIAKDVNHIIPLSGTPWKNRGSEFFPVLNMLDPVRFNSFERFKNNWVEYYYQGGKEVEGGIRYPERFKEHVKDIIIRYERKEVMAELPTIQRNALYCEMNEMASKAYNTEVDDFVKFWNQAVIGGDEDSFETNQHLLARLTRMRHITGLAKIPNTIEYVKEFLEETDRKFVVFAHHKDVQQIVFDKLTEYCIQAKIALPLRLTADMSSEARADTQDKFNGPNYRLLVASSLAAGEGLNLQTCSDCIIHERQWNPANEEQQEGRFIRIGQNSNSVIATYMLAEGSIDDHFHVLVERKRLHFHASMNNGEIVKWNEGSLIKDLAQAIVDSAKNRK